MPVLPTPIYRSPWYFFGNPHLQTIVPSLFRKVKGVTYHRERLEMPDGDFLDLDWSQAGSRQLVIVSHGLEGDSHRQYALGMVKAFNEAGWDALAWNCRGCSGEINRLPRFYHHGDYHDLEAVINYALATGRYDEIALVGFSMGGSMTLRLLGELGQRVPKAVKAAVAFSVPVDLTASVKHLSRPQNRVYARRFLRKLKKKIALKSQLLPEAVSYDGFKTIRVITDFDNWYTAPLHGFEDAEDFYRKASVRPFLQHITIPTLLVNALDDPFLTPDCFPVIEAEANPNLYLEMPRRGGHVGFALGQGSVNWAEKRALAFVESQR